MFYLSIYTIPSLFLSDIPLVLVRAFEGIGHMGGGGCDPGCLMFFLSLRYEEGEGA
jgi:hypothetical protein